jgi:hypothetical protein
MTMSRRLLAMLVGCAIGLAAGLSVGLGALLFVLHQPAIEVQSLQENDGVAVRGGTIDLVATVDRTRLCESSSSRYLWRWIDWKGKRIRQFVPISAPSGSPAVDVGESQFMLSLPVPPGVEDGSWFYRSNTADHCPWLPHFITGASERQSADVPVKVVDGKLVLPPAPTPPASPAPREP